MTTTGLGACLPYAVVSAYPDKAAYLIDAELQQEYPCGMSVREFNAHAWQSERIEPPTPLKLVLVPQNFFSFTTRQIRRLFATSPLGQTAISSQQDSLGMAQLSSMTRTSQAQ